MFFRLKKAIYRLPFRLFIETINKDPEGLFFDTPHEENIIYDEANLLFTVIAITFFSVYIAAVVLFVDLSIYIYRLSLHCKSLNTDLENNTPSWSDRLGTVVKTTLNAMTAPPLNTVKTLNIIKTLSDRREKHLDKNLIEAAKAVLNATPPHSTHLKP